MNAQRSKDEYGVFYSCGLCLLDHDTLTEGNGYCKSRVMPDVVLTDDQLSKAKPLSKAGIEYLSRPVPRMIYGRTSRD